MLVSAKPTTEMADLDGKYGYLFDIAVLYGCPPSLETILHIIQLRPVNPTPEEVQLWTMMRIDSYKLCKDRGLILAYPKHLLKYVRAELLKSHPICI